MGDDNSTHLGLYYSHAVAGTPLAREDDAPVGDLHATMHLATGDRVRMDGEPLEIGDRTEAQDGDEPGEC